MPRENRDYARGPGSRWSPFVISLAVVLLDQWTKVFIRHHFSDLDAVQIIPGWLRIIHTENPGAAFGMLSEGSPFVRGFLLIGVSVAVLCFVVSALVKRSGGVANVLSRIGLSLILGGAIGNLYDRIFLGTVTDFIEVYNGAWSFPAFNVADSAITIGSVCLILDLLWPVQKRFTQHPVPPPTEP